MLNFFIYSTLIILTVGCSNYRELSRPVSIVSPIPEKPHVIFTADRSIVRKGESIDLTVTFVNPTKQKIALPAYSRERNGYDFVSCSISVDWKGKNGASSHSGGHDSISSHLVHYLMPGEHQSFRMRWVFDDQGEGTATLTYKFGLQDDFPPIVLTVKTR
jgi:hypothetical protein